MHPPVPPQWSGFGVQLMMTKLNQDLCASKSSRYTTSKLIESAGIEVSKLSIVQKSDTFSYLADALESLQEMPAIGGLDVTHLTKC